MNISRIALLSAVLFIAPFAMASETPEKTPEVATSTTITTTTDADAKPAGFFTKAGNFVAAPFVVAGSSVLGGAGWIANKSYLNALISKITTIDCLKDTCINKPELIGKTIVILAGLAATYKMYTMYNTEDVDNDEDIFGNDEYEMSN